LQAELAAKSDSLAELAMQLQQAQQEVQEKTKAAEDSLAQLRAGQVGVCRVGVEAGAGQP